MLLFYNACVKSWDVIIAGGGIIGLTLSIELRKRGASVLVVERKEPGREASYAAAGMLADFMLETPPALQSLASASARMYPEFVHEMQDESGLKVDLRDRGAILFLAEEHQSQFQNDFLSPAKLSELEPKLSNPGLPAIFLKERSVDPRALSAAALQAAKHRDVVIVSGSSATSVLLSDGHVTGLVTEKTTYEAPIVVNCAGAWAGLFGPQRFPTRPVKGQMLSLVAPHAIEHVIRAPEVYLVPRSDGRLLAGSTLEEAGFDKRTVPGTIEQLHKAAVGLVPALGQARILEDWAGLRPGTPDDLPILGATDTPGYFVATGHFRDGILLAPVTARVVAQVVMGEQPEVDLSSFSAARFRN